MYWCYRLLEVSFMIYEKQMLLNGNTIRKAREFLKCLFSFHFHFSDWSLKVNHSRCRGFAVLGHDEKKVMLKVIKAFWKSFTYTKLWEDFHFWQLTQRILLFIMYFVSLLTLLWFSCASKRSLRSNKKQGASLLSIVKQIFLSIWRRDCQSQDILNFYHSAY